MKIVLIRQLGMGTNLGEVEWAEIANAVCQAFRLIDMNAHDDVTKLGRWAVHAGSDAVYLIKKPSGQQSESGSEFFLELTDCLSCEQHGYAKSQRSPN